MAGWLRNLRHSLLGCLVLGASHAFAAAQPCNTVIAGLAVTINSVNPKVRELIDPFKLEEYANAILAKSAEGSPEYLWATDALKAARELRTIRITRNGARFTILSRDELAAAGLNPTKFQHAFRDPDGVIWGGRSATPMTFAEAYAHCRKMGARLPTAYPLYLNGTKGFPAETSDWARLRQYMAGDQLEDSVSAKAYSPQLFLSVFDTQQVISTEVFWSQTVESAEKIWSFNAKLGQFSGWEMTETTRRRLVICVAGP